MNSMYLVEQFVTTSPGEPFLLFPFGKIFKGGEERNFTPELAAQFQLPHFKPPIKLGSHAEESPAAGHIIGLEVRNDGLYAIPEFNERGTSAISEGSYRYHSPEIIWDEGVIENPETGDLNTAPLIWGDALLHTPHLGESAALYTVEKQSYKESKIMAELTTETVSALERLKALFASQPDPKPEPKQEPTPAAKPSEDYAAKYDAAQAEIEQYRAEVEQLKAEAAHQQRIARFASEFEESEPVAGDSELHELLAGLDDEVAAKLTTKIKALSEQVVVSNLTDEAGSDAAADGDAYTAFIAAVDKYRSDNPGVTYGDAVRAVSVAHPEWAKEVSGNG